jgi:hemolysin III
MVIFIKPLVLSLPTMGLFWLIAGGLFYTVGALFYLYRWFPYNHAVWHLFVLAGSISHFITVLFYVLPIPVIS